MTITLRPEDEQLIARAIEAGAYQNADEVVGRALQILRSEDEWLNEDRKAVGEKIDKAFGQFQQGEFFSSEQSRADMEKRKAEWLREHHA